MSSHHHRRTKFNFSLFYIASLLTLSLTLTGCGPATEQTNSANGGKLGNSQAAYIACKDGTYTATGDYYSPGGAEQIQVTVTLKNNIITAASVQPEGVGRMSQRMQGMFAANFAPLVIGKNINDVQLGKVSGSSLTGQGFNDALNKIMTEAQS